MVSASVVSAPPRARAATVEPQRMHSALMPGASGSTRCVSPQASQESTASAEAIAPAPAICVPGKMDLHTLPKDLLMKRFVALLSTLAVLLLTGCGYNPMQSADEQVKAAWAEVVNQYQRRAVLLNLVNTIKGCVQQEQQQLLGVA